jgi:hypothetical protein
MPNLKPKPIPENEEEKINFDYQIISSTDIEEIVAGK